MKIIRLAVSLLLACAAGCDLPLMKSAEFDATDNYLSKYTLAEYLELGYEPTLSHFWTAMRHAGLYDRLTDASACTFLIPDNNAFDLLLESAGYSSITEFEPTLLRSLMEYLILDGERISSQMEDGAINAVVTASGDPLFISRKSKDDDLYPLYVNTFLPEGDDSFAGTPSLVIKQDMVFRDKVAQVVETFPIYKRRITPTDIFEGNVESDKITTLHVNVDTYVFVKLTASQADKDLCCNTERKPIIWFENSDLTFDPAEISSAVLNLFVRSNNVTVATDFRIHDISSDIWALSGNGADRSNVIRAVSAESSAVDMPKYTPVSDASNQIASFSPKAAGEWISVDLTSRMQSHYLAENRIPLAITIQPVTPFATSKGILIFGFQKESTDEQFNPAYIKIMGRVYSALQPEAIRKLTCPRNGRVPLTSDDLRYSATSTPEIHYTPNNILYKLSLPPSSGSLTRNGIPLKTGETFTQEEIDVGAICYFNTRQAAADSFRLEISDYTGSVVATPAELEITFN